MSPGRSGRTLRAVVVRRVGRDRRSPRPGADGTAPAGRHRRRRPQRPARLRPETVGDLLHQALITKLARRQGIPAHRARTAWRQPGHGPGRFWGVYGLKKAIAVVEITQDAYLAARRIVRRWSRNQAVYGNSASQFPTAVVPRTALRLVPRINQDTGVVTHRKVQRRRTLCNQGGLAGGYALVNDGPAFASQLAASLSGG